jgi:hypothetical protein
MTYLRSNAALAYIRARAGATRLGTPAIHATEDFSLLV